MHDERTKELVRGSSDAIGGPWTLDSKMTCVIYALARYLYDSYRVTSDDLTFHSCSSLTKQVYEEEAAGVFGFTLQQYYDAQYHEDDEGNLMYHF